MLLALASIQTGIEVGDGGFAFGGTAIILLVPVFVGTGGIRFGGNAIIEIAPLQYWQVRAGAALSGCADPYSPGTGERSFFE